MGAGGGDDGDFLVSVLDRDIRVLHSARVGFEFSYATFKVIGVTRIGDGPWERVM